MSGGSCSCDFRQTFAKKPVTSDANGFCLSLLFRRRFADLAGTDLIKFGIESKRSCKETSTEAFLDAISLALHDMRDICVEGEYPPTTRL